MDLPDLTYPDRLAWLLVLPILWWLARPPKPRRRIGTAHLRQWTAALAAARRRRRRVPWLRVLLLLVAFSSAVLAFTDPQLGGRRGPTALAVVVDASASMAAPGVWQEARAALERDLRTVPAHVDLRLAVCSDDVEVVRGDAGALLAALPASPEVPGRVDLATLAARTLEDGDGVAVWTITDGLGPHPVPESGALTMVGAPADNVGIVGLAVEDAWPLAAVEVEAAVQNFSGRAITVRLGVEGGVEAVEPAVVELAPGARVAVRLDLRRAAGGRVRVDLLEHDDGLALDDSAVLELPPPPAPDIAVLSDAEGGTEWIRVAAEALAEETGGRVVPGDEDRDAAGLLLAEGGRLRVRGGTLRMLSFGTRSSERELTREDVVVDPVVVDWDRTHPLTRGLDFSELVVRSCLRADFIGTGTPLISAEHGPLLVVDEGESATSVHAAFRLADSNLALLPAFPQLLRRCLAAAYREDAQPALDPANLLDAAESDLRGAETRPAPRGLPGFGHPGRSLAAPLLLLALALLAFRVWV